MNACRNTFGALAASGRRVPLAATMSAMRTSFRVPRISTPILGASPAFWPELTHGQHPSWKTHVDTLNGYAFDYPPAYQIREEFHTLYLADGICARRSTSKTGLDQ